MSTHWQVEDRAQGLSVQVQKPYARWFTTSVSRDRGRIRD
jgi:hypothetical protein